MKYFFLCILLWVLTPVQQLQAQFEEGRQNTTVLTISGTGITTGATNTVSYDAQNALSRNITNLISLKIDEQSTDFPNEPYSVTVNFNVEKKALVSDASFSTAIPFSLTVTYDTTTGAKYNVRDYIRLEGMSEVVKITVTSVTATAASGSFTPLAQVRLENEMRATRYYKMSNNSDTLKPTFYTAVDDTDAVAVSWSWKTGFYNNNTQLEWAWLENALTGYYTNGGVLDTGKLFRENSTRVDLDLGVNTYKISLLYPDSGRLYYRVRPTLRKNDNNIITGPWSAVQGFTFNGHQPNLNWQSGTDFVENGKSKTVIQYFDGTLRPRQTVTKDNDSGNTIVAETIYDLQGRANVQILPTPTIDQTIRYFVDFNRFNGQTSATQDPASFFDLTPADLQCNKAPALDITKGNGRYYSANNDWLGKEAKASYIPNANGYAYTETRFTDDATERVSVQGGVGIDHQIGSGHETKYYYGKPGQQELDALFATEVGYASHYSKNMVQDANGQMSVSYVDMHGRTVATALAGDAPSNLVSIQNSTDYPQASGVLTNQLLTPETNTIRGNAIESLSTLLVPAATTYNFNYTLNPAILSQFSTTANQNICFDCKYDLEISIRPEDCSGAVPVIKKYSNLQIVAADQACGTPMGFVGEGITTPTDVISFSQTLATGSWVVRKTLTINDSMFAIRRDSALKVFLVQTQQHIYDSVYSVLSAASGCALPAGNTANCDSCNAHIGSYSSYKTAFLNSIGNPANYDTASIYVQYNKDLAACAQACNSFGAELSTLANLRQQMLADMMPYTGQYAIDSIRYNGETPRAIQSTDPEAPYNIFSASPVVSGRTTPYFKLPVTESGSSSFYYTDGNTVDSSLYANGSPLLPTISRDTYSNEFTSSWANSLIYYHPEFARLKFAEDSLPDTYAWMDSLQAIDDFKHAQSGGYTDPINHDPYFTHNYVAADKSRMQKYVSTLISVTGYTDDSTKMTSIWQMANGAVLCTSGSNSQKEACALGTVRNYLDTIHITGTQRDFAWKRFKALYLSYRNDMVVNYIKSRRTSPSATVATHLQDSGKHLIFVSSTDVANQTSGGTLWSAAINTTDYADTASLTSTVNAYIVNNNLNTDKCVAQKPAWTAMLMQCEALQAYLNNHLSADSATVNTIISHIVDSLVMVCQHSITAQQPYGATSVTDGYPGNPQSFEAVVDSVFKHNGISTDTIHGNYFCNPFTITAPNAPGKGAPLFINYSNQVDSCNCSRFAVLKSEALSLGYSTSTRASMNQYFLAHYHDTLSDPLWQGLQACDEELYTDTCGHEAMNRLKAKGMPTQRGSLSSDQSAYAALNTLSCLVYTPIKLTETVAIPDFLNCGYQSPCLNCTQLQSLTTEFKTIYPWCSGVPYFNADATDAQTSQNSLWARFLNYRTGFELSVLDYMSAYNNCYGGSVSGYLGNGSDCGSNTAVDSLTVSSRLPVSGNQYIARDVIEFDNGFESNTNDTFETVLNSGLGSCSVSYGIAGAAVTGGGSDTATGICAFYKPLNDPSNYGLTDSTPCAPSQTQAQFIAQQLFGKLKDSLTANFDSLYLAKCLGARSTEQFYATYQPKEYHYTLYYYDQAGNLVKTLPPAAVKPNFDSAYLASVAAARNAATDITASNNELLATNYRYNTLNSVIQQKTPDAGLSKFWYDRVGRLAGSQNAVQSGYYISYTQYDVLGRVTEVGEANMNGREFNQSISQDTAALRTWLNNSYTDQLRFTVYDLPYTNIEVDNGFVQQNLRNRVSYSAVLDYGQDKVFYADGTVGGYRSATFYSYDIHGNVDSLLQDYPIGAIAIHDNRFKRILYDYDLISGKINLVSYQPHQKDGFYHHYLYDAENRLTTVETSRDSLFWERDASYEYYRHGPLARTVLGQNKVQGLDYAYTIQGWLKGENNNALYAAQEIGKDGFSSSANATVARDAFGFSLGYFANDYQPIGTTATAFSAQYVFSNNASYPQPLYNGNISNVALANMKLDSGAAIGYTYKYDQLNRLVSMRSIQTGNQRGHATSNWDSYSSPAKPYSEDTRYDPNGNIMSYQRSGNNGLMDSLTYQYERNSSGQLVSNRLRYVHDAVSSGTYSTDIDNQTSLTLAQVQSDNNTSQGTDNYGYDAIGTLHSNTQQGIYSILWTVYGKPSAIANFNARYIFYTYDPSGNVTAKDLEDSNHDSDTLDYYVRDAAGNIMSVYRYMHTTGSTVYKLVQTEVPIYGAQRLGVFVPNTDVVAGTALSTDANAADTIFRGDKLYELTNHLGNVLATITDKSLPIDSSGDGQTDYYVADVSTATDYYPFGMQMPGRTYRQGQAYRYGFNGKENDDAVQGEGNEQDYGMRVYDTRVGRFLSVDPISSKYPELTPYQFASNRPVDGVDRDGLEFMKKNDSYIWMTVDYDPVQKTIHHSDIYYRYDNIPPRLRDFFESENACSNCLGAGNAKVADYIDESYHSNEPIFENQSQMKDIDGRKFVGPDESKMPQYPSNKKAMLAQRANGTYENPITNDENVERVGGLVSLIQLTGGALDILGKMHLNNIIKDGQRQAYKVQGVIDLLQNGINNNLIPQKYRNSFSLGRLGDYLLWGRELTKIGIDANGKEMLMRDDELTTIGQSLWLAHIKDEGHKYFIKQIEDAQKAKADNTSHRQ